MARELKIKTNTAGTTTVVGNWELRAGSQDTTEHLARGSTYPGAIGGFHPINSDAANGYDAAPKLALLQMTSASGGNSVIAVTEGGGNGEGMSSILSVSVSQRSGTASTSVPTLSHAISSGEATLTLTTVGVSDVGVYDVMVLYY
tara:strand:+ start:205 stop:639 length:435 start_codon:yes stop_codon:yes gene_type:complete